jgi:alpha-beta hydrolase superfamily lysophospholipase
MPSTTATIAARDGVPLLLRRWPPVGEASASVLIVHGLGEHSGRYERTGTLLAATGLDVAAIDLQGFGGSGGRRAFISRWDTWLDDVEDRLAGLRAEGGGRPVVLLGHSMGALVALLYALSERPRPDLLILSAPALAADLPAWKKAMVRVLGRVAPTVSVANGLDGELLSRDPAVGADYVADPLNYHRTTTALGRHLLLAQERALAGLGRLGVPTLVIHGGSDRLVPTASSEVLAPLPPVDRRVYPDLRHETLNEPEGPQVAADIAVWIGARIGPAA